MPKVAPRRFTKAEFAEAFAEPIYKAVSTAFPYGETPDDTYPSMPRFKAATGEDFLADRKYPADMKFPPVNVVAYYSYGGAGSGPGSVFDVIKETYPFDNPAFAKLKLKDRTLEDDELWFPRDSRTYEDIIVGKPTKARRDREKLEKVADIPDGELNASLLTYTQTATHVNQLHNTYKWLKTLDEALQANE